MVTERAEDLPDQDAANDDARPVPADAPKRPRRRGSRSQRRLSWGRRLVYRIAVPIGMGLIHFFWATCRIVRVEGAAHVEDHLVGGKTAVICYWHRHQLMAWSFLIRLFKRGLRVGWLISASVDGEAISEIARRMGGGLVYRGSTTSKGAEAVRSIERLEDECAALAGAYEVTLRDQELRDLVADMDRVGGEGAADEPERHEAKLDDGAVHCGGDASRRPCGEDPGLT